MPDSKNNPWFGVSMVLVGVIAGYGLAIATGGALPSSTQGAKNAAVANVPSPAPSEPAVAGDLPEIDVKKDHIRGSVKGPIYLVEYSDFECPFCARHHPTASALIEANDNVGWVYRHFPLSFHPNAQPLAEASECVTELGGNDAFWKFADMAFEKGPDSSKIKEYADASGVDGAKVQKCVDEGKYADHVASEMAGGSAAGVSGTPGNILINVKTGETRLVSGAQPLANFQAAVDDLE